MGPLNKEAASFWGIYLTYLPTYPPRQISSASIWTNLPTLKFSNKVPPFVESKTWWSLSYQEPGFKDTYGFTNDKTFELKNNKKFEFTKIIDPALRIGI